MPYLPSQHSRNLRWIFESPHDFLLEKAGRADKKFIAESTVRNIFEKDSALMDTIAADPLALAETIELNKPKRLGIYAETLLTYFIKQSPFIELIANNLIIREGKKSVGEFDFLLRYQDDVYHLELSIKLYLEIRTSRRTHFVGTLRGDTLDKKIDRLLTHQLLLSLNPAAQESLARLHLKKPIPRALLKGFLFERENTRTWLKSFDEFTSSFGGSKLFRTPRSFERLASWIGLRDELILTRTALDIFLCESWKTHYSPYLVFEVREDNGNLCEVSRGFIMPPCWYEETVEIFEQKDDALVKSPSP